MPGGAELLRHLRNLLLHDESPNSLAVIVLLLSCTAILRLYITRPQYGVWSHYIRQQQTHLSEWEPLFLQMLDVFGIAVLGREQAGTEILVPIQLCVWRMEI